jgi:hypothetical protein
VIGLQRMFHVKHPLQNSGPALKPGGLSILYASARQKPAIDRALADAAEQPTFHEYVLLRRLSGSRITLEESAGRLLVVSRRPPTNFVIGLQWMFHVKHPLQNSGLAR